MKRFFFWNEFLCTLLATLMTGIFMISTVHADILVSGDIDPDDPSAWTHQTDAYVGYESIGTLDVTDGDSVGGGNVYLGYDSGARGSVVVDSEGAAWINSSCNWYYLYAGFYGTGTLEIINGSGVTNFDAYLGYHAGASGTVTVAGEDSLWGPGDLYTGNSGTGIIHITDGGTVRDSDAYLGYLPESSGTVTVDGEGSTWSSYNLSVGQGGTGIVHITNGGTVTHDSINRCYLGHDPGASGTVTVDGEGSTWSIFENLRVGRYGTGVLTITNGGKVTCEQTVLGVFSGGNGEVTIDGQGSSWSLSDGFSVGSKGTGRITITNGGTLTGSGATLGSDTNAIGTMIVDGNGSVFNGGVTVGSKGMGTLTVTNGGIVTDGGSIGRYAGGSGTATVDGTGSAWNSSSDFYVGGGGTGILDITKGGTMTCENASLGEAAGAGGTVTVDGEGSMWTNRGRLRVGDEGTGTLIISNGGTMTSSEGHVWNGTMTVDGLGSNWTGSGNFFVGNNGRPASLAITNGGTVIVTGNTYGGYFLDSPDLVISLSVDGQGSTWTNDGTLDFSSYGTGEIFITNGGRVNSSQTTMGSMPGSSVIAAVNGGSSMWTVNGSLILGSAGTGALAITDGGLVSADTVMVSGSILTIDVNSVLNAGTIDNEWTGYLYNGGTIRLAAGAGAESGDCTPLNYGTMDGDGVFQTLGGTWDADTHTVTVSEVTAAQDSGGATASFNLFGKQRALIIDSDTIDSETVMSAGAGFPSADASTEVSLTATVLGEHDLVGLDSLISDTGDKILSAWDFSIDGYEVDADNPVYLSLFAGGAANILDLTVWHYEDGAWTRYETTDLAFDGTYASFVADRIGTYAVTTVKNDSYSGDFEKDGDVDGSDIFHLISTENEITIEAFASFFGSSEP